MRRKFGQNFLVDKNIARKIVDSAELSLNDTVIEIGPGKGILTEVIAPRVKELIAVEIDRKLSENLKTKYSSYPNTKIINENFLSFALPKGAHFKIVANLPYNIATAILQKILPSPFWDTAVVMVQKEVGERIAAKPGGKIYGAFSIFCQYFAQIKILFKVGPKCFLPSPRVDSVVLSLSNIFPKNINSGLFRLVNLCFQQRRKIILNSLSNGFDIRKEEILKILQEINIDPNIRPEYLDLKSFEGLTYAFKKYNILK
ncbi:MAG: 16S rRNA (adenine(1518)-N(6)/adenine(1519)-N(6))-dimethyltransferase RsmA [Elusimicrobia bacterium]|nr:16S rRNA (adenine(1518)-N(6)/adenine(1519)-N(6))-dimethyltransferase RsmA [Elusimicrobiota bacterium]